MGENLYELREKMVQEKRRGRKYNTCYSVEISGISMLLSSTIQFAVGEVVGIVMRILKFFLLRYCLRGDNFRKTFQARSLKPYYS
jgi:hypothetical protein